MPSNVVEFDIRPSSATKLFRLCCDRPSGIRVVRVVRGLDGQVTQTLQDRLGLAQSTFSGLDDVDAVLGVGRGDPSR